MITIEHYIFICIDADRLPI
uniref:Uncharacterized protein n=1 Tax=Anopheles albimanus TaxID=7167 RepID=A0A182FZ73_ANOAL